MIKNNMEKIYDTMFKDNYKYVRIYNQDRSTIPSNIYSDDAKKQPIIPSIVRRKEAAEIKN
jgi:hypothetical protein